MGKYNKNSGGLSNGVRGIGRNHYPATRKLRDGLGMIADNAVKREIPDFHSCLTVSRSRLRVEGCACASNSSIRRPATNVLSRIPEIHQGSSLGALAQVRTRGVATEPHPSFRPVQGHFIENGADPDRRVRLLWAGKIFRFSSSRSREGE